MSNQRSEFNPRIPNKLQNSTSRKLKNRIYVFKDRYFNIKSISKFVLTLLFVIGILPFLIYFIVYNGYKQKIVTSTAEIPEEFNDLVVIGNGSQDSLKIFIENAEELYNTRNIDKIVIFNLSSPNYSTEDLSKLLNQIPQDKVVIDKEISTFKYICDSSKDLYNLDKFIVLSYEEFAVRTSILCNNENILTQSFVPEIPEEQVPPSGNFVEVLNEILKSTFNIGD